MQISLVMLSQLYTSLRSTISSEVSDAKEGDVDSEEYKERPRIRGLNSEVGNLDAAEKGYCGSNSDDEGSTDLFLDTVSELPPHHDDRIGMDINEFDKAAQDAESVNLEKQDSAPRIYKDPSGPGPYQHILKEALDSTGRWAFGVVAVEIWIFSESGPMGAALERADGGWWRDPVFQTSEAINMLEDPACRAVPATAVIPGVGVPGIIWSEESENSDGGLSSWRDLRQMANDEDRMPDKRTSVLADAFGLATGLIFQEQVTGLQGLVIFYARRSADLGRLSSVANRRYLRSSTDLLASVVTWDEPRRKAVEERQIYLDAALRRIRIKIMAISRFGCLKTVMSKMPENDNHVGQTGRQMTLRRRPSLHTSESVVDIVIMRGVEGVQAAKTKAILTAQKIQRGGGQRPPPPLSPSQCIFAWLGCAFSLLTLSAVNETIKKYTGGVHGIMLGPLGALVTMHYGLPSAPASQPRNSIFGMLVAASIAKIIAYIPIYILPVWIRIAVAPAVAIVASLALGIPHPPGGAVAVIFSDTGSMPWSSLGLLLFGYAEAIFFATIFINLGSNRTFPTYWGMQMSVFRHFPSYVKSNIWRVKSDNNND